MGKAAEKFGTMFGISSLATVSIEEIGSMISTPKLFQLYVHKDKELTKSMIDRCKEANFEAMASKLASLQRSIILLVSSLSLCT